MRAVPTGDLLGLTGILVIPWTLALIVVLATGPVWLAIVLVAPFAVVTTFLQVLIGVALAQALWSGARWLFHRPRSQSTSKRTAARVLE